MNTFKVTFYDGFEVFKVETYHNVINQTAWTQLIANTIVTLELSPIMKVENSEGVDYTNTANYFVNIEINELDNKYFSNYMYKHFGIGNI